MSRPKSEPEPNPRPRLKGATILDYHVAKCETCGREWDSRRAWPDDAFETGTSTKYVRWTGRRYSECGAFWCSDHCFCNRPMVRSFA